MVAKVLYAWKLYIHTESDSFLADAREFIKIAIGPPNTNAHLLGKASIKIFLTVFLSANRRGGGRRPPVRNYFFFTRKDAECFETYVFWKDIVLF